LLFVLYVFFVMTILGEVLKQTLIKIAGYHGMFTIHGKNISEICPSLLIPALIGMYTCL
jgi:hypothetical protein